jgi:D-inositol-3-phosphate glycosyltransferase
MSDSLSTTVANDVGELREQAPAPQHEIAAALLTGCQDKSYALGLGLGLASHGVRLDVIGNDWVYSPKYQTTANLEFLNFGGIQPAASGFLKKLLQVLGYYARLLRFVTFTKAKVLHILWNGKLEYFDRTLLMLYGRLRGRKLVLTAHNTNKAKRDSEDSLLNRLTLRIQYHLANHIFVHTAKMKSELLEEFGVRDNAVTIIPFGLYSTLPDTELTPAEAKHRLGIGSDERTLLFFGRIVPYKGLEYALTALQAMLAKSPDYRLIIAGEPMKGYEKYMNDITAQMDRGDTHEHVTARLQFIPDEETELYFKAADALVLPYKEIFQSGVLFVAFTFGLPVLAAEVGSFREDVIEGKTGFVFKPGDTADLAKTIETYFQSDLYASLDRNRGEIRKHFNERHSWDVVAGMTRNVYEELLK